MTQENSAALRLLVSELGRVPPAVRTGLRIGFRKAGAAVLAVAKGKASWSSRIPAAMSLRTSTRASSAGVYIRVDSVKAPHARPYEGLSDRRSTFRHPVFGNREVWVAQTTRPFLVPAARAGRAEVEAAAIQAVRTAVSGTSHIYVVRTSTGRTSTRSA